MGTEFSTSFESKKVLIRGISLPYTADPREALKIAGDRICLYLPAGISPKVASFLQLYIKNRLTQGIIMI